VEPSFDHFVVNRMPAVLRFTGVLTGDRHLAEDIVQEVLLKTHKRWDTIVGLDQPEAYVRRMVVNEYISWRRKWARIVPSPDVVDGGNVPVQPDHADRMADRADVADRLRTLAPRQRAVLVLRYYEGLADAEIAELLGCSVGTVRGYASRGLASLRIEQPAFDVPVVAAADRASTARSQSRRTR
jgi:RNA polymerase sigma-70 factor (sigma-E family)